MKYFVTIGPQTIEVEVDGDRVLVGGEAVDVHLAPLPGTPLYHLLLGGESWTVAAQPLEGDGQWAMGVVGERLEVAVQDEQSRETEAVAAAAPGAAAATTSVFRDCSSCTATSIRSPTTPIAHCPSPSSG